jgi:hypothetical protein
MPRIVTGGRPNCDISTLILSITKRGYDVEVGFTSSRTIMVIKHPQLLSGYIIEILEKCRFKPVYCYTIPALNLNKIQLHQSVFEGKP